MFGEAPYVFNGKPYYRLESTTMQMPQTMYNDMLRHRDSDRYHWDCAIAENMTFADLDEKRIRNAVSMGVRSGRMNAGAENEPIEDVLRKMNLLNGNNLTNAAVMLFTKNTSYYPELELRMGYFRGKDKMAFIDNKMEVGNFFDLHEAGMSFLFRNLRLSGEVKGLLREEKLEIPIEALREALTNSLCHRQYEHTNGTTSIAIYDDRVEIVNPGNFPPQLTADKIKLPHESYPYNKKIAQVLYMTTFLEKWGSGAKRMIELCHEQNVPEPEWIAENGTIKIIFKRPISGGNFGGNSINERNMGELSERQRVIYNAIKADGHVTAKSLAGTLAGTLAVSARTIERELSFLKNNGLIRKEGKSNKGVWIILQ